MIIKITIVEPLMRSMQSLMRGGISLSSLGFNPIAGVTGSAHGNVFAGGNVTPFARGGVVDGPTLAPMALFGEAGPEAIVPLKRGSDGNLGIAASGGTWSRQPAPAPNITIHNYSGAQPQVSRSSKGDATITLQKMVDGAVGDSLINGAGRRALAGNYGVKPFTGQ
jgi:phage-related minor tail protein